MYLDTKEKQWILIVDDDKDIRDSLLEVIKLTFGESVGVVEAKDGLEATSKINYQKFDCIITDLAMPRKEGEAFVYSVRHNNLNETTPVMIISGSPNINEVAKQFQFVEAFAKPYRLTEIVEKLKVSLKLNGNKNRVSADVLNHLIEGLDMFVTQITKEGVSQEGALKIKEKGKEVESTRVATLQFNIGSVKNTVSIMVADSDLESLGKICSPGAPKSNEKLMQSMSYVIMKHVIEKSGISKGATFKANHLLMDPNMLTEKRGLIFNLANTQFKVEVFATSQ